MGPSTSYFDHLKHIRRQPEPRFDPDPLLRFSGDGILSIFRREDISAATEILRLRRASAQNDNSQSGLDRALARQAPSPPQNQATEGDKSQAEREQSQDPRLHDWII